MKKLLTATLCLAAGTMLLQAQGLIKINQTGVVRTNTAYSSFSGGNETGGVNAAMPNLASGKIFYFQLLLAPMNTFTANTHSSTNPLASGWYAPTAYPLATNSPVGAISGAGGASGAGVATWTPGDASATADTQGTEMDFLLVGWSANLGTSWATVSGLLNNGFAGWSIPNAFFGVSQMGWGWPGGSGTPATAAQALFGVTATMPGGLSTTVPFQLFQVNVPEPSTIALAGLGGLAMLMLRRRK